MVNKIDEELIKKSKLRKLKEIYKEGSLLTRVINKIPFLGVHPKWREIKKYSVEEMDFLIKISRGDTLKQEEHERKMQKRYYEMIKEGTMTYRDIEKRKKDFRWDTFCNSLSNKECLNLKMKIEYDELMKRHEQELASRLNGGKRL